MPENWDLTEKELESFVNSLNIEQKNMPLSFEALRKSLIIISQRSDHRVVAIAGIRRVKWLPVAYIVVHRDFQNMGYGMKLASELHHQARNLGLCFVTLSVQADNSKAVHIYRKLGYRTFFTRGGSKYMIKIL